GPTLPTGGPTLPTGGPTLPTGGPTLPTGGPTLPTGGPTLPVSHASMPTFTIGQALSQGLTPGQPLALIHFANCFNMSVELLHTVAPFAEAASGYCNANFYTGAASYPAVFQRLREAGSASAEDIAAWFVRENHALLAQRGRHPIVGGALSLSRMSEIARGVEALADALLAVMSDSPHPRRTRRRIQGALIAAQQYDTSGDLRMDGPDQLTDLLSLARCIERELAEWPEVAAAARRLASQLDGVKRVGDTDSPWMDPSGEVIWDFEDEALAMNIFLPDPMRSGQWDWRTPFYVDINPGQGPGRLQFGVIDFLKETTWVEFIREYHSLTVFRSISVPGLFSVPTARRDVVRLPRERLERARGAQRHRQPPRPGPIAQRVARLLPKPDDIDD
ncbi:MAG: hypothetical protein J0M20_05250, partial [Burkholderiales bacterium]|nr:hypothetical protein [Burkholderiales bacterium]